MVRGQPRLSQGHATRSATQPGPNTPAHGQHHPHSSARSMSGPASYGFGGVPGMPGNGTLGGLGDQLQLPPSMNPMGGMSYDFSLPPPHQQQSMHHAAQQQQQQQQRNARYGPYPSPHALSAYGQNTLATQQQQQQQSHTPHASAVMGSEFDYFGGNGGGFQMAAPGSSSGGQDLTQQQQQIAMQRRASLAVPPPYSRTAHLNRSQAYSQQQSPYGMQGLEGDQDSSSSSMTGKIPVSYNFF